MSTRKRYTTFKLPMALVKEVQSVYGTRTATEAVAKAVEDRLRDEAWKRLMARAGQMKIEYVRRKDWDRREARLEARRRGKSGRW